MGFFNRISRCFQNKININTQKNAHLGAQLLSPSEKRLDRTELRQDVFQNEQEVANIALTPKIYVNSYTSEPNFSLNKKQEEYSKFIRKYLNVICLENAINKNPNIKRFLAFL